MSIYSLWTGYSGTLTNAGIVATESGGVLLRPLGAGIIRALRWYRPINGGSGLPDLVLWAHGEGNLGYEIARVNAVDPGSATGWISAPLDTPVEVGEAQQLVVGYVVHTGSFSGAFADGNTQPIPTNAQLAADEGPTRGRTGVGLSTYPVSTNIHWYAFDVEFEPRADNPVSGATLSDIDALLASYLTTPGANYSGSPLADVHTVTENTYNATQDAITLLTQNQTDINVLLSRLTEDVAAKLTVFLADYGIDARGFFDQITAQVQDVTDAQADIIIWFGEYTGISVFAFLGTLLKFLNGTLSRPQLAEGPDWELIDETDFVDNLLWPVEADVYRVTLSAFDPAGTSEPVGTETRHAYLGKWCPFNVQFSSEWHYFNTTSADLYSGGRMPGLGLILYRPGAGHVQAWRRTEAP